MSLSIAGSAEITALRYSSARREDILETVDSFYNILITWSKTSSFLGKDKIEIEAAKDDRFLFTISTPYGAGRFHLAYLSGIDGLSGSLVLERKQYDKYDAVYWEPVLEIVLPKNDYPYVTQSGEVFQIPVGTRNIAELEERLTVLGGGIVYAIINGRPN